ncbi:hypothetical protein L0N33_25565, partial [Roseburia faecis]|nr:hypothetical protein [Roseburia faecis]
LLQIEVELLAVFSQTLGLHFKTFKGLAGGVMLRLERTQSNRQLVRVILVLTGILAHPVELLARRDSLREQ